LFRRFSLDSQNSHGVWRRSHICPGFAGICAIGPVDKAEVFPLLYRSDTAGGGCCPLACPAPAPPPAGEGRARVTPPRPWRGSKRTASISLSSWRRIAVPFSLSNFATLKLVGKVTISTLTFSSGGRMACGSGLHKVRQFGSKLSQTRASV